MEKINPREFLKAYVDEYKNEPKGYYYLSGYAKNLLFLIGKFSNDGNLYFVKLRLKDFINDDLDELLKTDSKSKTYKLKLNFALNNLNDIKCDFFKHIENANLE